MKTLIVTRHAKAVESTENQSDISRGLSGKDSKYFKKIVKRLSKKTMPELIITSPAVRAFDTAKGLVNKFKKEIPIVTWDPLYDNLTNDLFEFIDSNNSDKDIIMITGHNPLLPMFIEKLTGKDPKNFPTLATAILKFDVEKWMDIKDGSGKFKKLLVPKDL